MNNLSIKKHIIVTKKDLQKRTKMSSNGKSNLQLIEIESDSKCDNLCELVVLHNRKISDHDVLINQIIMDLGNLDRKVDKLAGKLAENTDKVDEILGNQKQMMHFIEAILERVK